MSESDNHQLDRRKFIGEMTSFTGVPHLAEVYMDYDDRNTHSMRLPSATPEQIAEMSKRREAFEQMILDGAAIEETVEKQFSNYSLQALVDELKNQGMFPRTPREYAIKMVANRILGNRGLLNGPWLTEPFRGLETHPKLVAQLKMPYQQEIHKRHLEERAQVQTTISNIMQSVISNAAEREAIKQTQPAPVADQGDTPEAPLHS